ncbi:hypothetical protein VNO77_29408 [Canavalia gladiata]|uniref:Uncharacterized protein n=1 Tax=Canavalia gladiata TaxID=3824 RepID=A0AAN9Q896_CANGL
MLCVSEASPVVYFETMKFWSKLWNREQSFMVLSCGLGLIVQIVASFLSLLVETFCIPPKPIAQLYACVSCLRFLFFSPVKLIDKVISYLRLRLFLNSLHSLPIILYELDKK